MTHDERKHHERNNNERTDSRPDRSRHARASGGLVRRCNVIKHWRHHATA
nr:MAG TPA: hypothetical protein [Caudoviricetes sp.]